jgi:2,3-bisphosphoglycerate-dependent phosphoglycerate mutase
MRARTIAALIRHGEYRQQADTPSAHQPYALTAQGKADVHDEVDSFAAVLDEHALAIAQRVDSSNMLRAWQTAMIYVEKLYQHEMPSRLIDSHDALAERGLGAVANMTIQQIEKVIVEDPRYEEPPQNWKSESHYRLPFQGAESLMQAGERVAAHLRQQMQKLRAEAGQDTVKLFVGHGAAFRHAAFHLGVLEFEQLAQFSMFHARPVLIEYLDDGSWRHIGGDWKIRSATNGLD